jgi:tryptophanyl-tRNA synthetase
MDCKKVLLEGVVQELTPIRRRSAELDAEPQLVLDAIADGGRAARGIAQQTIREVREIMGLGAVTAAALG